MISHIWGGICAREPTRVRRTPARVRERRATSGERDGPDDQTLTGDVRPVVPLAWKCQDCLVWIADRPSSAYTRPAPRGLCLVPSEV